MQKTVTRIDPITGKTKLMTVEVLEDESREAEVNPAGKPREVRRDKAIVDRTIRESVELSPLPSKKENR